jgi:hypothetical protein
MKAFNQAPDRWQLMSHVIRRRVQRSATLDAKTARPATAKGLMESATVYQVVAWLQKRGGQIPKKLDHVRIPSWLGTFFVLRSCSTFFLLEHGASTGMGPHGARTGRVGLTWSRLGLASGMGPHGAAWRMGPHGAARTACRINAP